MMGDGTWDILTSPPRAETPIIAIAGVSGDPYNPDAIILEPYMDPNSTFFCDGEFVGSFAGTGTVLKPFASKRRLEQAARYWYKSGLLTLTTRDASYEGYITNIQFNQLAGQENRWQFQLVFSEGKQGLPPIEEED